MEIVQNINKQKSAQIIILQILVLFALISVVYASTLTGMIKVWLNDDDYSHAMLMPLVVGYLIWDNRQKLAQANIKPYWPGMVLLVIASLGTIYGVLGSDISAARISWWLMVVSIILFCYGMDLFKSLLLPIIMLGFTIPLPNVINSKLMVSLKLISSKLGAFLIQAAGFQVFVQGNVIDLGITQLQVVDACSGLRFVLPLIALGLIASYYFQITLWKRAVLVLMTLPIAVFMNAVRIAATGIIHNTMGAEYAEGFFHGFSGWIVFVVSFGMLFLCNMILNTLPPRRPVALQRYDRQASESMRDNVKGVKNTVPFMVSTVCLVVLLMLSLSTRMMPKAMAQGSITSFPLSFSQWAGTREYIDSEMVAKSGAEEAFSATYANKQNEVVALYLGYRSSPFLESEEFFHSPNVCLPSQGWIEIEENTLTIPEVHPRFSTFKVRRMLTEHAGRRMLVYFWFQTKNRIADVIFENRLHLALHALRRDTTSDTFVRLMSPLRQGETAQQADTRLETFTRDLEVVLVDYLGNNEEK